MNTPLPTTTLDTQGLLCPEPVMLLHRAVRKTAAGACIKVLATDPSTQRDIPKFCTHLGHTLAQQATQKDDEWGEVYVYWVVKRAG